MRPAIWASATVGRSMYAAEITALVVICITFVAVSMFREILAINRQLTPRPADRTTMDQLGHFTASGRPKLRVDWSVPRVLPSRKAVAWPAPRPTFDRTMI